MAILFPFPNFKARVRAMSSANWAEVPGGRGLASMVSKLEITAYPAVFFVCLFVFVVVVVVVVFSIQDKAASISVPYFLRIGQRIF